MNNTIFRTPQMMRARWSIIIITDVYKTYRAIIKWANICALRKLDGNMCDWLKRIMNPYIKRTFKNNRKTNIVIGWKKRQFIECYKWLCKNQDKKKRENRRVFFFFLSLRKALSKTCTQHLVRIKSYKTNSIRFSSFSSSSV